MDISRTNKGFRALAQWVLGHKLWVAAGFLAVLVFSFFGLNRIIIKTSFEDYLLKDDPMLLKTEEFKSHFGNDYYVAVLVRNEDIFSKQSLTLIRELSNELMDSLSYSDRVTSLTDLEFVAGTKEGLSIEQIVPEEIPSGQAALDSIRAKAYSKPYIARKLVSRDGTMTWIMVKLRPFPADSVWKKTTGIGPDMMTGGEAERIVQKEKYAPLHPNVSGMPYMTYAKTIFMQQEMQRVMLIAFIAAILVMTFMTRSLRGVISPILTTVLGLMVGFGIIGWTGIYVDMVTYMVAMVLTFACSIAYNIHVYNFFKTRFVQTGGRKSSILDAIEGTGWGVALAGLTTIAAMLTFLTMKVVPMRAMGLSAAICLFSVLLTCLFLTPVLLSFGKNREAHPRMERSIEGRAGNLFERFGAYVCRRPVLILTGTLLLLVFCCIRLTSIEPAFDIERTMGEKVSYVKKFMELSRTELGTIYSYDMMIVLPEEGAAKNPDNLRKLDALGDFVDGFPLSKRHSSVTDIIKDMNCTLNAGDTSFYAIPEDGDMVAQLLLLYENAGGTEAEYWMDYDYRRFRLQVEIQNYNSREVEQEMRDLERRASQLFPDAEISTVGNLPEFTVMQQYIVRGQTSSMLLSVLLIGIILVLVFSNKKIGLIGMIPNLAPAIVVGGMMGWLDYPLDMMTASLIPMVLGIAVDDTIHFINHAKQEFEQCRNYGTAIRQTFRIEGLAIVMSTLIISVTFAGFLFSSANQIRNWGLLAVAGMLSALLADLFLTPILLKSLRAFGKEAKADKQ